MVIASSKMDRSRCKPPGMPSWPAITEILIVYSDSNVLELEKFCWELYVELTRTRGLKKPPELLEEDLEKLLENELDDDATLLTFALNSM